MSSLNGNAVVSLSLSPPLDRSIDRLERDLALVLLSTTFAGLVVRELQATRQRRRRGKGGERGRSLHLRCRTVDDFERFAEQILPAHRFFYYSYKAGRGVTSRLTRRYFDEELLIIPRVLVELADVSLRVRLFG